MLTLIAVVGALSALAATGDTDVAWWGQALIALASAGGAVLLGFLGRLLNKGFDYLAQKTRISSLAEVDETIMGYVTEVYNSEVKYLKAAAKDGKLSPEEKVQLAKIPVEKAKEHFGVSMLTKLAGSAFESFLASRTENAVTLAKNAGKAARANPT